MDINKIILKTINSKASTQEYEALQAWKAESQQNIEFLNKMMEKQITVKDYIEFDKSKAWDKVESKLDHPPKSKSYLWMSVIAILAFVAVVYFSTNGNTPNTDHIHESNDEMINFALQDDSQIWLNNESTVVELSDFISERKVSLGGEAFFDITRNPEVPFTIELNDTDFITVLGTSFNVLNSGDDFDLVVYTGHVQLNVLGRTLDLYKNDRVTLLNGAYVKVKNSNKNTLSWKNKILVFDNDKLSDVFNELEDYYSVEFNGLADLDINSCRLRSRFDNESIDKVLSELVNHFNLVYTKENNIISIQSINCG